MFVWTFAGTFTNYVAVAASVSIAGSWVIPGIEVIILGTII